MRRAFLLIAAALLAACQVGGGSGEEASVGSGDSGTLIVTQDQIDCCYTEGQISFIRVTGNGESAERWVGPGGTRKVIARLDVPAGAYTVESWQRPCSGSCPRLDEEGSPIEGSGVLDPPADRCTGTVEVSAGETLDVLVEFAPGQGCTIEAHTDGLPPRVDGVLDCSDDEIVYTEQAAVDPAVPGLPTPEDAMRFALSRWLVPSGELLVSGPTGTAVVGGREVARAKVAEVPGGGWAVELLEYCR